MAHSTKMSNQASDRVRSQYSPRVRDGLCRHLRNKGMIINIDESPENSSFQRNYLSIDPHALPWDGTAWWCTETSKTIGPDDRPCDSERCLSGRGCYEAEDDLV
jgi:hypothetical protein